jgi:hypothetical protein
LLAVIGLENRLGNPVLNESIKTFSQRIIQRLGQLIFGLMAILMLIGIAWAVYEWILAWKPFWGSIAILCFGCMTGWLIATHPQRTDGMTIIQRTIQARGLVAAGLILAAFAWRIHELAIAWQPYGGDIATFCLGFVASWLIALHAQWEKGWRMSPRPLKILRPIAVGIAYTGAFTYGTIMIFFFLYWFYESVVSYWKPIAWCIGALTVWITFGWFVTRKDRIRASNSSESDLRAHSKVPLLEQPRTASDARAETPDAVREGISISLCKFVPSLPQSLAIS